MHVLKASIGSSKLGRTPCGGGIAPGNDIVRARVCQESHEGEWTNERNDSDRNSLDAIVSFCFNGRYGGYGVYCILNRPKICRRKTEKKFCNETDRPADVLGN